jgi:DNA polymerase
VKEFWYALENAAKSAVRNPGSVVWAGRIACKADGVALRLRLPSGRCLWYRRPSLGLKRVPWSEEPVESLCFYGENDYSNWGPQDTYGGKLVENVTQAVARDLIAEALVRANQRGFDPVLTVHDELVCDVPPGGPSGVLDALLCESAAWADGLPVKAAGFATQRYRKD